MNFELNVQKAVYDRLRTYEPLISILPGVPPKNNVFDHSPQVNDSGSRATFPYVVIGNDFYGPMDTDGITGFDGILRIHTWSIDKSYSEIKAIHGAIYGALNRASLDIVDVNLINIFYSRSESFPEDERHRHGVIEFQILATNL